MIKNILLVLSTQILNDAVCTLNELLMELKEDFAANNHLVCERASYLLMRKNSKTSKCLTQEELEKALVGAWDSDCSFEGPDEMFKKAFDTQSISKIYTAEGVPMDSDNDAHADICELIRSLIYSGRIGQITNLRQCSEEDYDRTIANISCPGPTDLEVCACTDNQPGDQSGWYTFIEGKSMQFDNLPVYNLIRK